MLAQLRGLLLPEGKPVDLGAITPVALVLMLIALLIPTPRLVLDLGMSLSLVLAVLMFITALMVRRTLDLSSMPMLLLMSTVFRLMLNVSVFRRLLPGQGATPELGGVAGAFSQLLAGDDGITGFGMFAMMLVINAVVVSKGLGRTAEVSARFHLDALPGKQMAIDAELSSGAIDEHTARARRGDLEQEGRFYSAMDGACKFIRGDIICTMVIAALDFGLVLAGGFLASRSADMGAQVSVIVGSGLVSQVAAVLTALAAGVIVSKSGDRGSAGSGVAMQLRQATPALAAAAALALAGSLVGVFPFVTSLTLVGCTGGLMLLRPKASAPAEPEASAQKLLPEPPSRQPALDTIRLELGLGLLDLAGEGPQSLREQIKRLRDSLAQEFGFVLPAIRITDNVGLAPNEYAFLVKGVRAGSAELQPNMLMAISTGSDSQVVPGQAAVDPTFGLPALWIEPVNADLARSRGWTVVDLSTVTMTHLAEVIKANMPDLLSYAETQRLLSDHSADQALISELIPAMITVGQLQRVLQALLAEKVSIRDFSGVLEGVLDACGRGVKSVAGIVPVVRIRLARQICQSLAGPDGVVPLVALSTQWEHTLAEALTGPPDDRQLALGAEKLTELVTALRGRIEALIQSGIQMTLVASQQIRPHLSAIAVHARMNIAVIAHSEIHRDARVRVVGSL